MSREFIMAATLAAIVGLGVGLIDVANSMSDKTLVMAEMTEDAVDCAFHGREVTECSPELLGAVQDVEDQQQVLEELVPIGDLEKQLVNLELGQGLYFVYEQGDVTELYFIKAETSVRDIVRFVKKRVVKGVENEEEVYDYFALSVGDVQEVAFKDTGSVDVRLTLMDLSDEQLQLYVETQKPTTIVQLSFSVIAFIGILALFGYVVYKKHHR